MNWTRPLLLNLLWLIPVIVILYIYRIFRNRKVLRKIADSHLKDIIWKVNDRRMYLKMIFLTVSFALLVIACAGPRWGREMSLTEARGYNVVFALDASSSMLAEDVRPNRLDKAKSSIKAATSELSGSRFGLVAFSGGAYIMCPLTVDRNAFNLFVDMVEPGLIPGEGTDIGSAIRKSSELFNDRMSGSRIIIIVSDGEITRGDPRVDALEARKEGIKIFTISAGTKEGAPVPSFDSTGKFKEYLKEESGETHISIVNDDLLKRIADAGDGAFLQGEGVELGLLARLFRGLKRGRYESHEVEHYKEKFIYFLSGALIFIMAGFFIRTGRE